MNTNTAIFFIFLLCFASYGQWTTSPKEKIKTLSLNSSKPVQKLFSTTNEVTIIEGLPFVLQSNLSGTNFTWQKEDYILKYETNNFLKIDYSVEGDAGQYTLKTPKEIVIFNVSFKRTIRVFINDQEIENFNNSNGHAETTDGSTIRLVPFIEGLPIRYTLDGSEPTGRSALYTEPITIHKKTYLRAKIEIPETDSTRIKVLYESF